MIELYSFKKIGNHIERKNYITFLSIADEKEVVVSYLNKGDLFELTHQKETVAVALCMVEKDFIEIKNIAVIPSYQGQGVGKYFLTMLEHFYKDKGAEYMHVGTANSSISNLAFYQRAGYRMREIRKGFFENYPNEIFENGIKAMDLIMFHKTLD
ncbi:putative acetyltransferase [Bacillus sp. TS-2]|nr:putative acetyltransferase [Bacillus sp. TS-2]